MFITRLLIIAFFTTLVIACNNFVVFADSQIIIAKSISMNGSPKYPDDFKNFYYVNPKAPKGGAVRMHSIGTYDSFNNFISKGVAADGLGMIYETLTTGSLDEAFTEYGVIAEKIEYPEDRSWVIYHLNPKAQFNDGVSIKVEDVIFSFNTLIKKGAPFYKSYYGDIVEVKDLGNRKVKFKFREGTTNRELVLITGQLPVLPKHFWEGKDFSKSTLEPPLGSGPYRIKDFKAGKFITYERVKKYWAINHPVNKGRYNFDTVRYDYYRDSTVALEAFKAGEYDFREENNSKMWASMYSGKTFEKDITVKEEIPHELPRGMQGFAFNLRRELFKDRKVREAIGYAFDFEWSNKNLFYGQYKRTDSFFENSELSSNGLPSKEELKILEPFRNNLPKEVFSEIFSPPKTDGTGNIRTQLRVASKLLNEAGWRIKDGKRINNSGKKLTFEILLISPAFERIVLPFKKNLERMGIEASVRVVDTSQYINRIRSFDFDMFVMVIGQSLSPGNEQDNYWSCRSAKTSGTRNYIGICNPAIDKLIRLVIEAPDRNSLITRTKALDRALLWGHYVIPHWHINYYRLSYWNKFSRPKITPKYGLGFFTWWIDTNKIKLMIERNKSLK